MRRFTRPLAFVAGAALAVTGVTLATLPSQAQTSVTFTKLQLPSQFTLLDTSRNRVSSTAGDATQTIKVGCDLLEVLEPAGTLLDINAATPTSANLGYGKNGIGVAGKKDKSGTRCADVDAEYQQSLEVRTGSAGGTWAVADLDIEFKGGSSLTWKAYRGTSTTPLPASAITVTGLPGQASDNGPDSGDGDNYRVLFRATSTAGYFDRLVLTPTANGAISLEGGGDGTSNSTIFPTTSASVFSSSIGEGLLLCDKNDVDGVTESGVTVFLTNCALGSSVPYILDRTINTNEVTFAVPDSATNEYRVEIEWTPEAAQLPVPDQSKVSYFRGSGNSLVEQNLKLCNGTFASPSVPEVTDEPEGAPAIPPGEGFCIVGQSMRLGNVAGEMVVKEILYGKGDPAFNRLSN
jgi:hypothetical protein